jgi:hypothetical protein
MRKRKDEEETGFSQQSMKDSPASLITEPCIYGSLVPSEYISLDSITYKIKQKEGEIQNISIRDKQKLKNSTPT